MFLSRSPESSPDHISSNVLSLNWVIGVASREFKEIIWQIESKYGGNLKISLTTVSHMASCNLRNLFLDNWDLVQICYFWIA